PSFRCHITRLDVGARLADGFHDIGIEPASVLAAHAQSHSERLSLNFPPVYLHPASFTAQHEQVGAIGAVDGDAAPLRHVADDGVARHRLAELGVAHHETAQALNLDAGSESDPVDHPPDDAGLHFLKILRRGVGM